MNQKPTALITGIEGFTGRYVANELESRGYRVHGLSRNGPEADATSICDLMDIGSLVRIVGEVAPVAVVHLAGISHVTHESVEEIYQANVVGTRNLLFALSKTGKPPDVVLLPSSGHVYGFGSRAILDESMPPRPENDYAVSKVAMEYMARLWMDKLPIVVTRPFNYTGRGQSPSFLVAKIAEHFRSRASEITLGDLDVSRDFTDVRDIARCYGLLVAHAPVGQTLNICSGQSHTVREILAMATEITGHSPVVKSDETLFRDREVSRMHGSNTKLRALLPEWEPRPLKSTLQWMLER